MIDVLERRRALLSLAKLQSAVTSSTSEHAISELRAFQVAASALGESYVVLEVRTRSGLAGYGECRSLSKLDMKNMSEALIGRPATAYEVLGSLVPRPVRGGLNMALLDIMGKATQAPVYRLLGGPTRNKARAITRLSGSSDAELRRDLDKQLAAGFRAFLLPIPAPTARDQGSAFIHAAMARLETLRAAAPAADFALEAHAELTPGDAGTLAASVEHMHPLWFDEPCAVSNIATIRKIADAAVVPLSFGRTIADAGTFQDLLREGVIDLLRPDILTHGISGICGLAAMAETYYVDVAPWHEGGPIANAAALHIAASIPNFFAVQLSNSGAGVTLRDGFFELPKSPGLGVSADEKNLEGKQIV